MPQGARLTVLTAFPSALEAAAQSLLGSWPRFVVLTGNGIDYLCSGANYGRYDTHQLSAQGGVCHGGCFPSAAPAKWASEVLDDHGSRRLVGLEAS